ncbi:MAG: hypothetical protein KGJ80_22345, partial [Chloroflexota bacterium]|nr:hypothetical protein [Chloroflexota bacterium]
NIHIDDLQNAWAGCTPPNAGDICDKTSGFTYTLVYTSGHTYNWTVSGTNYCGKKSADVPGPASIYCLTPTPSPTPPLCDINAVAPVPGCYYPEPTLAATAGNGANRIQFNIDGTPTSWIAGTDVTYAQVFNK